MQSNPTAPLRRFIRAHDTWIGFVLGALLALAPVATPHVSAASASSKRVFGKLPITELGADEAILHALNRLAFGPRPGDLDRVRQMGLEKWIEQQLAPQAIDDSALAKRLERYPTLAMSSAELLVEFPNPAEAARRAGLTPEEYRKQQQARLQALQRSQPGAGRLGRSAGDPEMAPLNLEEIRTPQRIVAELAMAKLTRAIYSERQLEEVMADFWFNHFNVFAGKGADRWLLTSYERDAIRPHALGKFRDLLGATAEHPAMLFYLDNWMSVDPKAAERLEREVSQRRQRFQSLFGRNPRALDLLLMRRGRLPANRQPMPQGQQPPQQLPMRRGLNENYARELMELHTLGVDGGYTQQDVIEVARAFTGWTLRAPRRDPEFLFDDRMHDPEPKTVLGKRIDAGGKRDGEAVLDLLARHPSTAKFISTKLARRFVADEPPAALVERMAKAFRDTDGDIRAVLRAMIYAPEFWSRAAYRAKIKKPFELVASAVRALGAEADVPLGLTFWTARIGEPLYQCQPPTGYADKAEAWVNTGALLNRMNFALALASGRIRGVRVGLEQRLGGMDEPNEMLARAIDAFLGGQASPQTRDALATQMRDPAKVAGLENLPGELNAGVIAGMVLGTPEFQRR